METDQEHILWLGKADEGRPISSDEFANAEYEEPWRYERVDGRLVIVPPAGESKVRIRAPWRDRLALYNIMHSGLIDLVDSAVWTHIDDLTDRIGDIGVYLEIPKPRPRIPDRVPDIVYDVINPDHPSLEMDEARKRQDYYRFGVPEYVVLDHRRKAIVVFLWQSARYRQSVLTGDAVYTSPMLPGLAIPLAEVFPAGAD